MQVARSGAHLASATIAAQGSAAPLSPDRNPGHRLCGCRGKATTCSHFRHFLGEGKPWHGLANRKTQEEIAPVLASCFPPVSKFITRHFLALVVHNHNSGVCNLDIKPEPKELSEPCRQYPQPAAEGQQQSFARVWPKSTGLLGFS